ncbi:MAG: hypothetical protein HF312_17290 [Ignavibacteria bacterium]|jgi:hypothetical protein|nr:hypothetical protein [Ignavibacteria bacterium]
MTQIADYVRQVKELETEISEMEDALRQNKVALSQLLSIEVEEVNPCEKNKIQS